MVAMGMGEAAAHIALKSTPRAASSVVTSRGTPSSEVSPIASSKPSSSSSSSSSSAAAALAAAAAPSPRMLRTKVSASACLRSSIPSCAEASAGSAAAAVAEVAPPARLGTPSAS